MMMRSLNMIIHLAFVARAQLQSVARPLWRSQMYPPPFVPSKSNAWTSFPRDQLQNSFSPYVAGLPNAMGSDASSLPSDNSVTVCKIEGDLCSQTTIDKKLEGVAKVAGFQNGECAAQKFAESDGTGAMKVPFVGEIPLSYFRQELASENFVRLFGETLLERQGGKVVEKSTRAALAGSKAVAIYYSAKWCRPCKSWRPRFQKAYTDALKAKGLEVVFVSLDNSQEDFDFYYGEQMPWLAVPYNPKAQRDALLEEFHVKGIPRTIIVDSEANVITTDGKDNIEMDPQGNFFPWKPKDAKKEATQIGETSHVAQLFTLTLPNVVSPLTMVTGLFVGSVVITGVLRLCHGAPTAGDKAYLAM